MMPPTSIDGTDITGATIDGTDVQEITVDGQTVFSAEFGLPYGFEDQTLSDKFVEVTANAFNAYSFDSNTVQQGNFSLRTNDINADVIYTQPGLNLISPGDTYEIYGRLPTTNSSGCTFAFGGPDFNNSYALQFNANQNNSRLAVRNNGNFTALTGLAGVPELQWARIEIIWPSVGNLTLDIYDDQNNLFRTFSTSDASLSGGGFGFRAFSGPVFWDNLSVI